MPLYSVLSEYIFILFLSYHRQALRKNMALFTISYPSPPLIFCVSKTEHLYAAAHLPAIERAINRRSLLPDCNNPVKQTHFPEVSPLFVEHSKQVETGDKLVELRTTRHAQRGHFGDVKVSAPVCLSFPGNLLACVVPRRG